MVALGCGSGRLLIGIRPVPNHGAGTGVRRIGPGRPPVRRARPEVGLLPSKDLPSAPSFVGLCSARSAAVTAQNQLAAGAVYRVQGPELPAGPALVGQGCPTLLLELSVRGAQHGAARGVQEGDRQ